MSVTRQTVEGLLGLVQLHVDINNKHYFLFTKFSSCFQITINVR